jgi:hypothetical protein
MFLWLYYLLYVGVVRHPDGLNLLIKVGNQIFNRQRLRLNVLLSSKTHGSHREKLVIGGTL